MPLTPRGRGWARLPLAARRPAPRAGPRGPQPASPPQLAGQQGRGPGKRRPPRSQSAPRPAAPQAPPPAPAGVEGGGRRELLVDCWQQQAGRARRQAGRSILAIPRPGQRPLTGPVNLPSLGPPPNPEFLKDFSQPLTGESTGSSEAAGTSEAAGAGAASAGTAPSAAAGAAAGASSSSMLWMVWLSTRPPTAAAWTVSGSSTTRPATSGAGVAPAAPRNSSGPRYVSPAGFKVQGWAGGGSVGMRKGSRWLAPALRRLASAKSGATDCKASRWAAVGWLRQTRFWCGPGAHQ